MSVYQEPLDIVLLRLISDGEKQEELKSVAAEAFEVFKSSPRPTNPIDTGMFILRTGLIGILGGKESYAAIWVDDNPWIPIVDPDDWLGRVRATAIDVWLRLVGNCEPSEYFTVMEQVASLRLEQTTYEPHYLEKLDPASVKGIALELIALYHLVRTAEIFAHFHVYNSWNGENQIDQLLKEHFDCALAVCRHIYLPDLELLIRLLMNIWYLS